MQFRRRGITQKEQYNIYNRRKSETKKYYVATFVLKEVSLKAVTDLVPGT
jgi:phosphopantetheinyl transferase (holo-ACP synthase)